MMIEIRQHFKNFIKLSHAMLDSDEQIIDKLVEEVERCNKEYTTKIKSAPVSTGDFYDLLYSNHMSVMPVVK